MKSLALILSILFASLLFVETEVKAEDIDLEDSDDDGIPDDEEGVNICFKPSQIFQINSQFIYWLLVYYSFVDIFTTAPNLRMMTMTMTEFPTMKESYPENTLLV